jgi:hypothetical protein
MKLPDSQIRYVDIPELSETFADSVKLSTFDGSVTIVELCVTRLQDPKPTKKPEAKRVPVCRLVLTPDATVDLHRQLQNMIEGMVQSGVLKQVPIQETTGTNH